MQSNIKWHVMNIYRQNLLKGEKIKTLLTILRGKNKNCTKYCVSKKYWPILYGKLLYKTGHYSLNTLYALEIFVNIEIYNKSIYIYNCKL